MDREAFLQLATRIPKRATPREILGFAWEVQHDDHVFVDEAGVQKALGYVWPELQPRATPQNPTVGFAEWPADLLAIRTDFDSGPFLNSTEAAGWNAERQDALIALLVDRGYQWCVCSIVNGDTSDGRAEYDGFAGDDAFWTWIGKLASARIVPIVVPFQGSQDSWKLLTQRGYRNEWAKSASFEAFIRRIWDVTEKRAIYLQGFENDKKFAAYDGDPDKRGPGEWFGWAAAGEQWAKRIHQIAPGMPVGIHTLPGSYGPQRGEGGRDWTPESYWRNEGVHLDFLAMQFDLDGTHDDAYYVNEARKAARTLRSGVKLVAFEYVRPSEDKFLHQQNVGEDRARALGRLLLQSGFVTGVANGC